MDPKAHKMLEEHEGHFVVQGPEGGAFRVAKHGLSEKLRERIRLCNGGAVPMSNGGLVKPALGMPPMIKPAASATDKKKPQGMGESTEKRAEVRGYADGGPVPSDIPDIPAVPVPLNAADRAAAAARDATSQADPAIPDAPVAETDPLGDAAHAVKTVFVGDPKDPSAWSFANFPKRLGEAMATQGRVALSPPGFQVPSMARLQDWEGPPLPGEDAPIPAAPAPAVAQQPPQQPANESRSAAVTVKTRRPGAPAPTEALPGVVAPQVNADLAQYQQDAIDANAETAKAQQRDKQRQILAADAYMADRQAENDKWSARGAAIKKRNDAMQADILANKIDPNRLWNSSTAGQQGTAIIGLILGGLGSGITKGPNYANEALDRAVAMDVASQEKNLATKETAMGRFIKEGYDNETARALALGEKKVDYAAQIERSAAQFGSESAMPAAMAFAAKTRAEGVAQQEEAMTRGFHLANAVNDANRQNMNDSAHRNQMNAAAQKDRQDVVESRFKISQAQNAPKVVKNPINLPDGRVLPGNGEAEARETNDLLQHTRATQDILGQITKLGSTGFFTTGAKAAKELHDALIPSLEKWELKNARAKDAIMAVVRQVENVNPGAWRSDLMTEAIKTIDSIILNEQKAAVRAHAQADAIPKEWR